MLNFDDMEYKEEKIQLSPLLEMIYEIFKEDIKKGKLRTDTFKGMQAVGKSAIKAKTFHQPAIDFR